MRFRWLSLRMPPPLSIAADAAAMPYALIFHIIDMLYAITRFFAMPLRLF